MRRKILLSPLVIVILIILFGVGIAGAAIYIGNSGDNNTQGINLQKGLVGWWKFDGNAKDSTPNGNNGTVTGATLVSDRKGTVSKAYSFNGTTDHVLIGDVLDIGTNDLTIEAWVKPASVTPSENKYIVSKTNTNTTDGRYALGMSTDGKARIIVDVGAGISFNGDVSLTTDWTHIVGVWDRDGDMSIYVNGVYDNGTSIAAGSGQNYDIAQPLRIGAYTSGSPGFTPTSLWAGLIDGVRIYNRALSQTEITALYQEYDDSGIVVSDLQKGLLGQWKFDGNARDWTPRANNGAISGATLTTDRKGTANKAYSFDGIGNYINLSTGNNLDMGTSDRTYSAWFKINGSYSSARTLFASGAGGGGTGNGGIWIYVNGTSSIQVDFSDGTASRLVKSFSANKSIHDGAWHHFIAVFDRDASATIYVDGVVSATSGLDISAQAGSVNDNYVQRLGAWANGGGDYFFPGLIDDARIYNRVLSTAEIGDLYGEYNPGLVVSDLQKGLVGQWKFNGNAKDYTPYSNNGTVTGATKAADRKGQTSRSYNFGGVTDYIEIAQGHGLLSTDITVGMWIYPTSWIHQTHTSFISSRSTTTNGFMFFILSQGNLNFDWSGGGSSNRWDTGYQPPLNTWTHLVMKRDSAGRYLYVNGALQNSTGVAGGPISSDAILRIGADTISNQYNYQGSIDDVRIYNRALSPTEITSLYESY